jgi:NADPH:quinone reductase-like Zn-dependent oxidoreductase
MKAFNITPGGGLESLRAVECAVPKPSRGQILVKIAACSMNARDIGVAAGAFPTAIKELIPLSDGAGEVVELGADVEKFAVGDRVMSTFFQAWPGGRSGPLVAGSALGGPRQGMLAQYVILEQDGAVRCPAHLSFQEAAALPGAAVTAWHALVEYGQVSAGETVLVLGTGGVSIFALQIARMLGARVIATSSSGAKMERLKALGAELCIDYTAQPDWAPSVVAHTKGGVDIVVEVGGAGTFGKSLSALRTGGKIALIGALTKAGEVNPLAILAKRANLQGIAVGSTQMAERLCAAMTANSVHPVIDRVFPFSEAPAAFEHMRSGSRFGKIVIDLSNE